MSETNGLEKPDGDATMARFTGQITSVYESANNERNGFVACVALRDDSEMGTPVLVHFPADGPPPPRVGDVVSVHLRYGDPSRARPAPKVRWGMLHLHGHNDVGFVRLTGDGQLIEATSFDARRDEDVEFLVGRNAVYQFEVVTERERDRLLAEVEACRARRRERRAARAEARAREASARPSLALVVSAIHCLDGHYNRVALWLEAVPNDDAILRELGVADVVAEGTRLEWRSPPPPAGFVDLARHYRTEGGLYWENPDVGDAVCPFVGASHEHVKRPCFGVTGYHDVQHQGRVGAGVVIDQAVAPFVQGTLPSTRVLKRLLRLGFGRVLVRAFAVEVADKHPRATCNIAADGSTPPWLYAASFDDHVPKRGTVDDVDDVDPGDDAEIPF